MVPSWLETLSIVVVLLSILCASWIAVDLFRSPQKTWIMDLVSPLTALYSGPVGLWADYAIGRKSARTSETAHHAVPARTERQAHADPAFAASKRGHHQVLPRHQHGGGTFTTQITMMLGLATAFPVNWWLIRRGVKEAI